MLRSLLLFIAILPLTKLLSQPSQLPDELKPFITRNYVVLDYCTGDLNADKQQDVILVLKDPAEDSIYDERLNRPLLILLRQYDGRLREMARNDSAVMGRHEGGVFGDPYQQIDISNNGFTLSFYGGSAWRWAYEYRFDWKPAKENWLLVRETQTSFNSGDPDMTLKEVVIPESELGPVPFRQFSAGSLYQASRWRVRSPKTFFYASPQTSSQPRGAYLLKGDRVTGLRLFTNFVEVSYENSKGRVTDGFILRKDLELLQ